MIDISVSTIKPKIDIGVSNTHPRINVEISPGGGRRYDEYAGPYEVYPDPVDFQILETENKLMTQNVLAMPIPFYRTSNPSGGDTIYIGE